MCGHSTIRTVVLEAPCASCQRLADARMTGIKMHIRRQSFMGTATGLSKRFLSDTFENHILEWFLQAFLLLETNVEPTNSSSSLVSIISNSVLQNRPYILYHPTNLKSLAASTRGTPKV